MIGKTNMFFATVLDTDGIPLAQEAVVVVEEHVIFSQGHKSIPSKEVTAAWFVVVG